MDGIDGFSDSFSDFFFRLNALTCEHCSTFGLKVNFTFCPLMLSWISPAPTSIYVFAVLKNGLPKMRGILVSTSMSRTTNGDEEILDLVRNVLRYSCGIAN